ncbi:DUF4054 domain-containing protein [Enterobacter asburiae]|uniref:DUF4054 domain-containing protein n=1 Tax=Enterobacter asburiae TaxID=61645 RepID=UPI0030763625
MAVVVFDIVKFRAMFPEFSGVTDPQLAFLFDRATDYLDNTNYSLVIDPLKRERLLYLLMAHMAYMRYGDGKGNGGSGVVGRLSSASEGSISASFDLGAMSASSTWFTLSPYGMDFWQATKVYRMATYYPGSPYG